MAKYVEQTSTDSIKEYVVFNFEIGTLPLWWTEEGKRGIYTKLNDAIYDDEIIYDLVEPLQDEFEETCFTEDWDVLGFPTDEAMEAFNAKLKAAYEFLKDYLKGRYEVLEPVYFKHRIDDVY